jgi:pyruvate/2-oxoglutarate dehydrogenase complex dihydrolipoamide dehydrogenase (E3) component
MIFATIAIGGGQAGVPLATRLARGGPRFLLVETHEAASLGAAAPGGAPTR